MKKIFLCIMICSLITFLCILSLKIIGFNNWIKDYPNDDINRLYFKLRMFKDASIYILTLDVLILIYNIIKKSKKESIISCIIGVVSFVLVIVSINTVEQLKPFLTVGIFCLIITLFQISFYMFVKGNGKNA